MNPLLLRYLPHLIAAAVVAMLAFAGYRWAYSRGHTAAVAACELDKAAAYQAQQAAYRAAQDALQRSYGEALALTRVAQEKAAAAARDWRRRYEGAVSTDPGCQAWAASPVQCPVPVHVP